MQGIRAISYFLKSLWGPFFDLKAVAKEDASTRHAPTDSTTSKLNVQRPPIFNPILSGALILLCSITTFPVWSTEFECRAGEQIRQIRLDYPGYEHLCEVSVTKRNQPREVRWYANSVSTFCSEKIDELVAKHQNQWGFKCEQLPDHNGIDKLTVRQRQILDTLVRQNRYVESSNNALVLLGARALVEQSALTTASATSILAVQLFMSRTSTQTLTLDGQSASVQSDSELAEAQPSFSPGNLANRLVLLEDNGESYDTVATLEDLNQLIQIDENGYSLDSVLIDKLHPNGNIDVTTLVAAPGDNSENFPSCFGQQRFVRTSGGIQPEGKHEFICE